ncbi:hypothetical protein HPB50_007902 [Hyalomma asiaticum]|uniref:Uncharacterized protein n=1 Tax=Hyalomma asiaticum TaxID=266040 RepID=A0ACB7TEF2_HYAAI|nr:hypothetical protein HPB50_007902 [Hyalomma asiaticum]
MSVIDVLEYIHSYDDIHADMKASVLLLCFNDDNENEVYLVDFGLAWRSTKNGRHKKCKEDLRKAHNVTVEFTDNSRRGNFEIQEYNLLQRHSCRLLWEDNLKVPEYVSQQKSSLMEDISLLISTCFPHWEIPCGITEFVQCAAPMKFEDTPDYKRLQRFLEKGIQAAGFNPDGRLPFTPPRTQRRNSFSPKKPVLHEIIPAEGSTGDSGVENAVRKPPPSNASRGGRMTPVWKSSRPSPATTKSASGLGDFVKLEPKRKPLKNKALSAVSASASSKESRRNGFCKVSNSIGLDNLSLAVLEVLQRKEAPSEQQQERSSTFGWKCAKALQYLAAWEPFPVTCGEVIRSLLCKHATVLWKPTIAMDIYW